LVSTQNFWLSEGGLWLRLERAAAWDLFPAPDEGFA
jgi:hypothetical protein